MAISPVIQPPKKPRSNRCLIDAFSCTLHGTTPYDVIHRILGLDPNNWKYMDYGRYNYRSSAKYGAITLLYNGRFQSMGICLELTGQGCAELVQLTKNESIFFTIISSKVPEQINLTRIDIAADDFNSILDIDLIAYKTQKGEIRTRMMKKSEIKGLADTDGHTVYIGSESSNSRVRIYDKQAQLRTTYPWVRVEMVLRKDNAKRYQELVLETIERDSSKCNEKMAMIGMSVLADRLCFVDQDNDNISRCTVSPWWEKFLDGVCPLHLSSMSKVIPSIAQAAKWVTDQVSPTLTLLLCLLGPEWLQSVLKDGAANIKDERKETWLQEMTAVGIAPTINPDSKDLHIVLMEAIKNYTEGA